MCTFIVCKKRCLVYLVLGPLELCLSTHIRGSGQQHRINVRVRDSGPLELIKNIRVWVYIHIRTSSPVFRPSALVPLPPSVMGLQPYGDTISGVRVYIPMRTPSSVYEPAGHQLLILNTPSSGIWYCDFSYGKATFGYRAMWPSIWNTQVRVSGNVALI